MKRSLADRLTSRSVSLALMVFGALAGALGAVVPQRGTTAPVDLDAWYREYAALAPVVRAAGLDHTFSTWWFLGGLALFTASLAVATFRMLHSASRTYRDGPAPRALVMGVSLEEASRRAIALGYWRIPRCAPGTVRFARHRTGWWGSSVMHVGMLITICVALVSAAFSARGVIDLSEGEVFSPGDPFLAEESGPLSSAPELGRALRLDGARTESWPTGELKRLSLDLSLGAPVGTQPPGAETLWSAAATSVNKPLRVDGHTIYVSPGEFGDAAFLVLSGPDREETRARMEFSYTASGTAEYSDIAPTGWPLIEGRWDPYGVQGEALLTLRFVDDAGVEHRARLEPGQTAALGPYEVEFALRGVWARLIVVRPVAVAWLFIGFAVIAVGSLMLYLMVPREMVLAEADGGVTYTWRAARMARSYASERDEILGRSATHAEEVRA